MPATPTLYQACNDQEYILVQADVLEGLKLFPDGMFGCCVTSPPYFGLRNYQLPETTWGDGWTGCLGLEPSPELYIAHLVEVFREVRRTLSDSGTCWIVIGDSYANDGKWGGKTSGKHVVELHGNTSIGRRKQNTGLKQKDLIGIPWMLAFALRSDGWYLRQEIIWAKPAPMPESVKDRCTRSHESIFMLTKSPSYYYDHKAIYEPFVIDSHPSGNGFKRDSRLTYQDANGARGADEQWQPPSYKGGTFTNGKKAVTTPTVGQAPRVEAEGKNKRDVWTYGYAPFKGAHFACFPPKLIEPMILAGCPPDAYVLDPFMGSGTTLQVAIENGRSAVGIEMNEDYHKLAKSRLAHLRA